VRPPRLPFAASRVIRGSSLEPGVKLTWLECQTFDRGEAGAYISAASLARRLGVSQVTIERHRAALKASGLLQVESRGNGRTASWYCTLPAGCVPSPRPEEQEVARLVAKLNRHLERTTLTAEGGPDDRPPSPDHRPPSPDPTRNPLHDGGAPSSVREVLAQSRREKCPPLHPAPKVGELLQPEVGEVLHPEVGAVAHATSERPENGNRGQPAGSGDDALARELKARLDAKRRGGVP